MLRVNVKSVIGNDNMAIYYEFRLDNMSVGNDDERIEVPVENDNSAG